ncbi:hypothetical protein [Ralstonia sp. UBA689]|uniref:hypothetical protein n=1 Tax=Ralstonia sp. UBA689 TaxID=1947373 RepID=UPI0025FDB579|nr:hypothetical protein [Ralstonia sp. UBA689]
MKTSPSRPFITLPVVALLQEMQYAQIDGNNDGPEQAKTGECNEVINRNGKTDCTKKSQCCQEKPGGKNGFGNEQRGFPREPG